MIGDYSGDHSFAIKYTTDAPHCIRRACHLSGLSGCNFEEAVSWGKVKREASKEQVFSDATITVALEVQALRASSHLELSAP